MGILLKTLIAGACCAIIASGAAGAWSAHQRYEARNDALRAQMARAVDVSECRTALEVYRALTNNRTNPEFTSASRRADECAERGFIPAKYWLN